MRLKILIFVACYLPGHKAGGPIRTIANMVEVLGDDFDFYIVTSDRDLGDEAPYSGVIADNWCQVGKAKVYYTSPSKRRLSHFKSLISEIEHDILYLNSLFNPVFTLLPLVIWNGLKVTPGVPIIVATRGELSAGALQIKKYKKMFFLRFAKALNLYSGVLWHASSLDEKDRLLAMFGGSILVHVASNLPNPIPVFMQSEPLKSYPEQLRVIFISRISRIKNLEFALKILAQSCLSIRFDIWGPLEDQSYWNQCQTAIKSLPSNVHVQYYGALEHAEVNRKLSQYDLFFLPTRGENYGHIIAEALSAGTPVLISDQTPWHNLDQAGVGWDLALNDESGFLDALNSTLARIQRDRLGWRRQVHDYAVKHLTDPELIEVNRQLFHRAIQQA